MSDLKEDVKNFAAGAKAEVKSNKGVRYILIAAAVIFAVVIFASLG